MAFPLRPVLKGIFFILHGILLISCAKGDLCICLIPQNQWVSLFERYPDAEKLLLLSIPWDSSGKAFKGENIFRSESKVGLNDYILTIKGKKACELNYFFCMNFIRGVLLKKIFVLMWYDLLSSYCIVFLSMVNEGICLTMKYV